MTENDLSIRRNFLSRALGYGAVAATAGAASMQDARAQAAPDFSQVTNYAALRAYGGSATIVYVRGATSAGDGGEGFFQRNSGGTYTDDGGTVLTPSGGAGSSVAWIRNFSGAINARWFDSIQSALKAAGEPRIDGSRGGEVYLPPGNYTIEDALQVPAGVSLTGAGDRASMITAVDCDAINCLFPSAFGNTVFRDLYLKGIYTGTPPDPGVQHGIRVLGEGGNQLHGLTIERCIIDSFGVGVRISNVWNYSILNNWMQWVEVGIKLSGGNMVGNIAFNKIVRDVGFMSAQGTVRSPYGETPTGIVLNSSQVDGVPIGSIPNENVQILCNWIQDFHTGISAPHSRLVNIQMNDIEAYFHGIYFKVIDLSLNIKDNHIAMQGETSSVAIYGSAPNYVLQTQVNIEGNSLFAYQSGGCTGIKMNEPGAYSYHDVRIVRNVIQGMSGYDILLNNPGPSNVENNRCLSQNVTKSIKVGGVALKPVFVLRNSCKSTIEVQSTDVSAQALKASDNIVNGGSWF